MYAVFLEVDADESHTDIAREVLPARAAPSARDNGARGGYWLAPQNGRGIAVVVFEREDIARQASAGFIVGQPPFSGAPDGLVVKTVEIREVLASVA